MEALDGNAVGGLYTRAPGVAVRCRTCHAVLAVIVEKNGLRCVDLRGLRALH